MAQITITIPDNKLATFSADFIKAKPIPTDDNGVALYTANQWLRMCVVQVMNDIRNAGARITYNLNVPANINDVS